MRCGKALTDPAQELCRDCRHVRHSFVRGVAVCSYRNVSSVLYRFKYGERSEYAAFLGGMMASRVMREPDFASCSLIVPFFSPALYSFFGASYLSVTTDDTVNGAFEN